jgi:hypothetical protein
VGLVGIGAVDLAQRDHPQRRGVLAHVAHLHARGVGAQQAAIAEVERVVHRARRVVRREVERFEVVPVVLDFRTIGQVVAQAREDVGHALHGAADRVDAAAAGVAPGQGDVDRFACQARIELRVLERRLARRQGLPHGVAHAVDRLAGGLALLRRQRTERLELRGDAAALTQQRHAQRLERVGGGCRLDVGQGLFRQ